MLGHQQRCMRCMVDRMAHRGLSIRQLQVIKRQPVLHLEFSHRCIKSSKGGNWKDWRRELPGFYEHSIMLGGMIRHLWHLHGRYASLVVEDHHLHLHKTIQDRSWSIRLPLYRIHWGLRMSLQPNQNFILTEGQSWSAADVWITQWIYDDHGDSCSGSEKQGRESPMGRLGSVITYNHRNII